MKIRRRFLTTVDFPVTSVTGGPVRHGDSDVTYSVFGKTCTARPWVMLRDDRTQNPSCDDRA